MVIDMGVSGVSTGGNGDFYINQARDTGVKNSIMRDRRERTAERAAGILFEACAFTAVAALLAIALYMVLSGTPAIQKVGLKNILFGTEWSPTADEPRFGILFVILTSLWGTALAVMIGAPAGVLTAVFLAEVAEERVAAVVRPAVELLAGIPSVVYGLLGLYVLNPAMYRLERKLFAGSETHRFTGGANFLSAVLVLAVMILPTVVSVSEASVRAVPREIRDASRALGATRVQTIFRCILPAARPGIATAVALGVGRALGEAMAITLVSGGSVNLPLPFRSVRFLTTAIVSEMGYSQGTHRQVLFTVALVLFVFVMLVDLALERIVKRGTGNGG